MRLKPGSPLPELSDSHVLLRATQTRDLPAIEVGIVDPDVVRWIGPPHGTAEVEVGINVERWASGSPTFSICELDGTCVGLVWVNVRPEDRSIGSVGYWLLPTARGRGLATASVRLISRWAVDELGITTLRLTTAPDNHRSQQVAARSGFRRVSSPEGEPPGSPLAGQVVHVLDIEPRQT